MAKLPHLQAGQAGEAYVLFKLLSLGHQADLCGQIGTYDLVVDIDGKPHRVQVKSVQGATGGRNSYRFKTCKGSKSDVYDQGDFDIAAYVALDIPAVRFELGPNPSTKKSIPCESFTRDAESSTWVSVLGEL